MGHPSFGLIPKAPRGKPFSSTITNFSARISFVADVGACAKTGVSARRWETIPPMNPAATASMRVVRVLMISLSRRTQFQNGHCENGVRRIITGMFRDGTGANAIRACGVPFCGPSCFSNNRFGKSSHCAVLRGLQPVVQGRCGDPIAPEAGCSWIRRVPLGPDDRNRDLRA
jgi:hypothetical protein